MGAQNLSRLAEAVGLRLLEKEATFSAAGEGGFVARVSLDVPAEAYVVHTPHSAAVASRPEIVGRKLESMVAQPARLAALFLKRSVGAGSPVVFLHILRGSRGYRLHDALQQAGLEIREQFVRVVYTGGSGEKHLEAVPHVATAQMGELSGGERVLVVADTVASGRTMVEALGLSLDVSEFKGARISRVVVYGFVSEAGAVRVAEFLEKRGVEAVFLALEDFTALASNNYDMPLYGPDTAVSGVRPDRVIAGATVSEAWEEMAAQYFPGMDQPGDWSERQCLLYNGHGYERGGIREHLERSLKALDSLYTVVRGASWYEGWMDAIYRERRAGLEKALEEDHCAPEP